MNRHLLAFLALIILAPACKTAGPKAPPGPPVLPEPLGEYTGELRILRHEEGEQTIKARPGQAPTGGCELAVEVRTVTLEKETARFSLGTLGLPKVRGQAVRCRGVRPGLGLLVEGLTRDADPTAVRARVDQFLRTPEAYLETKGITFDRPPGETPTEVASREVFSGTEQLDLGRHVTAWPEVLLSVDPWYYDASGRLRQEGEIELEAVVGTDGRLHEPRVRTGVSPSHERAVLRVLPLWRFEPARRGEEAVAARILLRPVFRIF
jgi:hypothetical protein